MLKRWAYILLSAWLINAVVCFQPNISGESHLAASSIGKIATISDATLLGVVFNHFIKDKDSHHHDRRIPVKKRYLTTRSQAFNLQLPCIQVFNYSSAVQTLALVDYAQWEKKVFLPPLHHFLFRLNPF
jgi:hypothetical protein